ncbi:hypothetical protein L873DRAFT_33827 [Choiromyces venosus 120613-1]|uniref:HTH psq-type domain-containing protein n=1 Tax=Choiromyces venosus 120613-1 TaxID=1336337 RepID=A0A3N4K6S9_9PEZI|nr:hypothetical protein L873DRAFT_33827 [Choiromyces venosus 120613-1]
MPVTHTNGKGISPRVQILKQAAILTLHWHASLSFSQISTKLKVPKSTTGAIGERAKSQAADPEDFNDVLGCLGGSEEGHGPAQKIVEGSAESEAL